MINKTKGLGPFDLAVFALAALALIWVITRVTTDLNYKWQWEMIPQYLIRFDQATGKWVPGMILTGLLITLKISFWATITAIGTGIIAGTMKSGPSRFLRMISTAYVEVIRNIPAIVWLFIFYYFLGDIVIPLAGIDRIAAMEEGAFSRFFELLVCHPSDLPVFFSGIIALALYEGAYFTEIIRAGMDSIGRDQWESSAALGLSRHEQLRYIILPQALRKMLPPTAGQIISTVKDSSIVSVISIQELTFQGMELMSATFLTFEVWITILFLYFSICFCCSLAVHRIERNLS